MGNNGFGFMDALNIFSIGLQMQNAEAIKIDELRQVMEDKLENKINKKLDLILKKLEAIERKLDF